MYKRAYHSERNTTGPHFNAAFYPIPEVTTGSPKHMLFIIVLALVQDGPFI